LRRTTVLQQNASEPVYHTTPPIRTYLRQYRQQQIQTTQDRIELTIRHAVMQELSMRYIACTEIEREEALQKLINDAAAMISQLADNMRRR
jgi:DNA-directed RNA polymerase subunit L